MTSGVCRKETGATVSFKTVHHVSRASGCLNALQYRQAGGKSAVERSRAESLLSTEHDTDSQSRILSGQIGAVLDETGALRGTRPVPLHK